MNPINTLLQFDFNELSNFTNMDTPNGGTERKNN